MARAVFITDKLMHAIGLHGKSFIPLIMGFGCGVPAIMATRVIENKNQRLITILMVPFMSCSARLPVYILLIGTFFAQYAGTVLFLIYLAGIVVAIISAFIFSKFVFKEEGQPFVMELPPYRVPTLRSTLRHMWYKGSQYLKKMGGVILIAAIAVWALNTFPLNEEKLKPYDSKAEEVEMQYAQLIEENTTNGHELTEERDSILKEISLAKSARHDELSYLGRIGKGIEPAMRPLGFDWKMSVSLLTGIIAKETVVSTMAVLYQAEADEENAADLSHKLREEKYKSGPKIGQPVFTNIVALAFLAFVLLYFPCVAAVAAIYKESKSKWFTALSVLYTTGVAWIVAFAIYQIGSLIVG
jgi:ferrous iron transport protein B